MSIRTIDIPSHCPLCHKAMGDAVHHVVLRNATVVCVRCWHLTQEMIIKGFNELPDSLVRFLGRWREFRRRASFKYWFIERPHNQKVIERNSGEHLVIDAEIPVDVA